LSTNLVPTCLLDLGPRPIHLPLAKIYEETVPEEGLIRGTAFGRKGVNTIRLQRGRQAKAHPSQGTRNRRHRERKLQPLSHRGAGEEILQKQRKEKINISNRLRGRQVSKPRQANLPGKRSYSQTSILQSFTQPQGKGRGVDHNSGCVEALTDGLANRRRASWCEEKKGPGFASYAAT